MSNLTIENEIVHNDTRSFIAPRAVLDMYQKISFPSFKVWASLLTDISEKEFSDKDQFMPLSVVWQTLNGRLSHKRLEKLLDELQTTLVKKDEFLPQTASRKISSFTMLGPTEITTNSANDVTSLKYRFMNELLQILRDDVNREKFVIEMRTFTSLKGAGGEHAKSLLLFCTPHIVNGSTQPIDIEELRKFMGLENAYVDESSKTIIKTFMRDVIKKGVSVLSSNPYVDFDIIDTIRKKDPESKQTYITFKLKERRSIKNLLSEKIESHNSPTSPDRLRSMLINFWTESQTNGTPSYAPEILEDLLSQFRFVDKYIKELADIDEYNAEPVQLTAKLFSISTAVTQLWLDGHLEKTDSKIYNYAYAIFKNPQQRQIESLCQKFLVGAGLVNMASLDEKQSKKELKLQQKYNVKQIQSILSKYKSMRIKKAFTTLTPAQTLELDKEFYTKSKRGLFGSWAKKAIASIEIDDLIEQPLLTVLSRRTLVLYKEWITNKAMSNKVLQEETVEELCALYPDSKRHCVALDIPLNVEFNMFKSLVDSIVNS